MIHGPRFPSNTGSGGHSNSLTLEAAMFIAHGPQVSTLTVTVGRDLDSDAMSTPHVQIVAPNGRILDVVLVGEDFRITDGVPSYKVQTSCKSGCGAHRPGEFYAATTSLTPESSEAEAIQSLRVCRQNYPKSTYRLVRMVGSTPVEVVEA